MQGIYKLVFKGLEDFPYIGQSLNIEARYKAHITSLKRGGSNYKLQEAYEMCGEPALEIVELTKDKSREAYWIEHYDVINTGLNMREGPFGEGYNHAKSKYTREQLISALKELSNPANTLDIISAVTGVSNATINDIRAGRSHLWLQDEFPELYEALSNINRATHSILKPVWITSPEGIEYEVEPCTASIRSTIPKADKLLVQGILRVLKGETYKGWTLKGTNNVLCTLISPIGTIHEVKDRQITKFAKENGMTKQGLHYLINHPKKSYLGWKHLIEK